MNELNNDKDFLSKKSQQSKSQLDLDEVPSIYDMKLHDVIHVHQYPYYRVMRVADGWLYNFWDNEKEDYNGSWVFAPFSNHFQ